jgi:hypothetical protein
MEMRVMTPLSKVSEGFWGSFEGIGMRLEMFSGSINTGIYHNALQVLAPAHGVQYFKQDGRSVTKMRILRSILWAYLSARHVYA